MVRLFPSPGSVFLCPPCSWEVPFSWWPHWPPAASDLHLISVATGEKRVCLSLLCRVKSQTQGLLGRLGSPRDETRGLSSESAES